MVALPLHRRIDSVRGPDRRPPPPPLSGRPFWNHTRAPFSRCPVAQALLAKALRQLGHAVRTVAVVPARLVYAVCGSAPGEIPCLGWISRPGAGWSIVARVLDESVLDGEGPVAGGAASPSRRPGPRSHACPGRGRLTRCTVTGGGHCATFVRGAASWLQAAGAYTTCRVSRPGSAPPVGRRRGRGLPVGGGVSDGSHSGRAAPPAAGQGTGCPRFVLDGTVIRLAKWLRVLSVDAEVAAEEVRASVLAVRSHFLTPRLPAAVSRHVWIRVPVHKGGAGWAARTDAQQAAREHANGPASRVRRRGSLRLRGGVDCWRRCTGPSCKRTRWRSSCANSWRALT